MRRREVLLVACLGGIGLVTAGRRPAQGTGFDPVAVIRELTGKVATASDRVRLQMPPSFPTGYTVPVDLDVASPMTEEDHVRHILLIAPRNPIIEVARFRFSLQCGEARVSTRIRLAAPQFVLAAAEMSDDTLLMASTWVAVATDGCQ